MTVEERKSAYDEMTTEKVSAPVVGLALVCLVVMVYLIVDFLLSRARVPGLPVTIGPLTISGLAAVPALLVAFPYFRNAYFRAVVLGIAPLSALIAFTLGTIVGGLATPTEAASCGAFGAALLALVYGRLDMKSVTNAAIGTMVTSAMVLFLAVASNVFGAVFTKLGAASLITNYLLAIPLGDWWKLALIMAIFFVLGWPFEWPVMILVFLPIVLPVVEKLQLGLNKLDLLIWFGALTAVNMQTSYLSPPVAMSAYYLRNVVPQWSLGDDLPGHVRLHGHPGHRARAAAAVPADRAVAAERREMTGRRLPNREGRPRPPFQFCIASGQRTRVFISSPGSSGPPAGRRAGT